MNHMKAITVEEFDRIQDITAQLQKRMIEDFGPNPADWPIDIGADNYVVRQVLAILERIKRDG